MRLIGCLAFTDRLSDLSINLGDNTTFKTINGVNYPDLGMSKLRIPGKINVNTASPEVLASIPILNANPKLIGTILAYRWRTTTTNARIPIAYQLTPVIDFTNVIQFPGYGIRSLAELQIPIMAYQTAAGLTYADLADRDSIWGQMYNALTVRSDTFVVYAYLEAVRQNPPAMPVSSTTAPTGTTLRLASAVLSTDDPTDHSIPAPRRPPPLARHRRPLAVQLQPLSIGTNGGP